MARKVSDKLATNFAGLRMRAPVGVGPINIPLGERFAITPEVHAEVLLKHVQEGAGFVYIPTLDYVDEEVLKKLLPQAVPRESVIRPVGGRFTKVQNAGYGAEGLLSFSMTSVVSGQVRLRAWNRMAKVLEIVKKRLPEGVPLIACNSPLGNFPESAVASAKKAEELGVDLLEVNFGCGSTCSVDGAVDWYLERKYPLVMGGPLVGEHFDLVEKMVKEVVKAVHIPVGVKVTSEIGFPRMVGLARNLRDIGVKYIEISNYAPAIAPPDIYNRGKSLWPYIDGNPFVAASGGLLRMGCYKNVAGVAKFAPGIEIAASGGLSTPEHVIEVMMLGAGLTEIATGILLQGRAFLRRTLDFMEKFMDEQGYNSVADFVGLGVQHIEPCDTVEFYPDRVVAEVDPAKCKGSGLCTDHICVAMVRENGKAKVIPEACNGCGLCVENCPNGAISLKLLDHEKKAPDDEIISRIISEIAKR